VSAVEFDGHTVLPDATVAMTVQRKGFTGVSASSIKSLVSLESSSSNFDRWSLSFLSSFFS
jgi:hypothetical protein